MSHRINYFYLLIVALVGSAMTYMLVQHAHNIPEYDQQIEQFVSVKKDVHTSEYLTKEKIGELEIFFSKEKISTQVDKEDLIFLFKDIPLSVSINKNVNLDNLSIMQWYKKNTFENEGQAPSSYEQKEVKISGINSLKTYFHIINGFGRKYYETVVLYVPYKTDIYEIWYYKLPENPEAVLSPADIETAKEYERIVEQIVQSLKFTE